LLTSIKKYTDIYYDSYDVASYAEYPLARHWRSWNSQVFCSDLGE